MSKSMSKSKIENRKHPIVQSGKFAFRYLAVIKNRISIHFRNFFCDVKNRTCIHFREVFVKKKFISEDFRELTLPEMELRSRKWPEMI